jgi:protease IV
MSLYNNEQQVTIKHKLPGFFTIYLLSTIPGLIISLLIAGILFVSFLGAVYAAFTPNNKNTASLETPLMTRVVNSKGANASQNKILVYKLKGAITSGISASSTGDGIYIDTVKDDFKKIAKDESIKSIVFKFNSPGGEVFASEVLGDEIQNLLNAKKINKGTFYFDSVAASGALWATYKVPNYIIASPYGETGSIGVRMGLPNIAKLADNIGYKEITIKSGASKDIGSPFRDPSSDELTYFQNQLNTVYDRFLTITAKGRNLELNKVKSLATGLTYFNQEAQQQGLVDEVNSINRALEVAAKESNITDYETIEINSPSDPFSRFFGEFNIGKMLGINNPASDVLNRKLQLKPGVLYSIDENKINQ